MNNEYSYSYINRGSTYSAIRCFWNNTRTHVTILIALSTLGIYDLKKNEFVDEELWPTDTKKIINELKMNKKQIIKNLKKKEKKNG